MKLLTREALLSFRRAPLLSVLSVTTIAFSLFTVGLFGLVAVNLRAALKGLEERVEIVAFTLRGTPSETIVVATQDIAAFPEVRDVSFVSEEAALTGPGRADRVPRCVSRSPDQSASRLDRSAVERRLSRCRHGRASGPATSELSLH